MSEPENPNPTLDARVIARYKKMLTWQFSGTAVLILALAAVLLVPFIFSRWQPPILLLVLLAGVLGAFFSALTRLYNIDDLPRLLSDNKGVELDGGHLIIYSFVPPLTGAIAAVVLYVAFGGGLLQGGLFPEFTCKKAPCGDLLQVVSEYGPKEAQDYAKALIWAFVAGFSERLVPDTLQALSNKGRT